MMLCLGFFNQRRKDSQRKGIVTGRYGKTHIYLSHVQPGEERTLGRLSQHAAAGHRTLQKQVPHSNHGN